MLDTPENLSLPRPLQSAIDLPQPAAPAGRRGGLALLLLAARARWLSLLVAALIGALMLTGMFAREPWKADEPYSVGMVLSFADGSDWVVPRIASVPFMEKPPLMYWTAALTARATDDWLPFFDGAQLATVGWLVLMLWMLGRAGEALAGGGDRAPLRPGVRAMLWMLGTVGALEHLHKLTADVPFTAGAAIALAGLVAYARSAAPADGRAVEPGATSALPRTSWGAGLLLGSGVGIAFLSKGLLVPGVVGITALLALALPAFRRRSYIETLAWALLAALPWLLIWPWALWRDSPSLFVLWFWDNNFGRYFGFEHLGGARGSNWDALRSLIGLSFPAGWVALAAGVGAVWSRGWPGWKRLDPAVAMLWIYVAVFVATLWWSAVLRDIYLLPMFPALALLASRVRLPQRLDRAWAAAAIALFSVLGLAIWLRWVAMVSGHGQTFTFGLGKWLPLDWPLRLSWPDVLLATAIAVLWMGVIGLWRRGRADALLVGFAGLTFLWGSAFSLLLPWVNAARGYDATFAAMEQHVPADVSCIWTDGVGDSERAMVDLDTRLQPIIADGLRADQPCPALLVEDKAAARLAMPSAPWRLVWQGGRPGDTNERYRLFLRNDR